jgi:putative ABC transport system ATP-binding protein
MATTVRTEQVSKVVSSPEGPLHLLDGIHFSIAGGEAVAVVGASGSGKTTLLGLLAGLDVPTSGAIFIGEQDITRLTEEARAALRLAQMGFVFQSFNLLSNLTALENVMLPLELKGVATASARGILDRVGLGTRIKHYPNQLSGGEQQRVAIARAFVTRPTLLFADEPTGSLDVQTGRRVIDLLFELNSEHRTTLILVTHDMALASRCHRRLTLQEGRLQE